MTLQATAPVAALAAHPEPAPAARSDVMRFRPEIQGLRSLAVLMVVVYHVFLDRISGGVDIFLMISAFLLTLAFVRRAEAGRPFDLSRHWLHRFKRLLPAAVVTIFGTLIAAWIWIPTYRLPDIVAQGWASLLYFQNWLLASRAVDYFAPDDSLASPLLHFWSLSIQGQVFILWPLLLWLAALVSRRTGLRYRRVVALLMGGVFVASLAYSVQQTATNQAYAYFDTRTRLWEFAAGSLLALAMPYLHPGWRTRIALGWLGVLAMLATGILLPVEQSFPGYIALWPIVAASLVIVAGHTNSRFGVDRILMSRFLLRTGDASYALYLVHWPILVTYLAARGQARLSLRSGIAIIALSVALAFLVTRFVEQPLRKAAWTESNRRRTAAVIALSVVAVAVPLVIAQTVLDLRAAAARAAMERNNPGARSLEPGFVFAGDADAQPIPYPGGAPDDRWVWLDEPCEDAFQAPDREVMWRCFQTEHVDDPEKLIIAIGDSHVQQMSAALAPLAKERDWQLVFQQQPACRFGEPSDPRHPPHCTEWLQHAFRYVLAQRPDAVLVVSTAAAPSSTAELLSPGFEGMVDRMRRAGIEVVAFRDNPRFDFSPFACAQERGASAAACSRPLSRVHAPVDPASALAGRDGLHLLDLTDLICPDETCRPVVGNVYVFIDDNHLSVDYLGTMSGEFSARLLAVTGW